MGFHQYHSISSDYKVPIVVTGFEPLDLLEGIRRTIEQLESGHAFVDNAYERVVSERGNLAAKPQSKRCSPSLTEPGEELVPFRTAAGD